MNIYKVELALDPRKALEYKTENGSELPDALFEEICNRLSCERVIKVKKTFNGLSFAVCCSRELSEEELEKINADIAEEIKTGEISLSMQETSAKELLKTESLSDKDEKFLNSLVTGEVSDSEVKKTSREKNILKPEASVSEPDEEESAFEKIEKLIAADGLKAWAKEMKAISGKNIDPAILERSLMSMTYLISATVFESIGSVLCELLGKKNYDIKEFFVEPDPDAKESNMADILKTLKFMEARKASLTVCVFNIERMQGGKDFATWLKFFDTIRNQTGKAVFIFSVPYLETVAVNDIHERIRDILPNRVIAVKPLTTDDYLKYFGRCFEKLGMNVTEEAYGLVPKKIAEEKSDGRFYGLDTINKICEEIIYSKLQNCDDAKSALTVTEQDVKAVLESTCVSDGDDKCGMEKLEKLTALEGVKTGINEMIASVHMQRKMGMKQNSMHMMFSGAPGTGKTVVARILGEIMHEEHILSGGGFYEVSRKDLVGSYVGHTAPKTAEVCKLAYGGVLFIDEAYMLDGGGENDFGKEAIGTLIAEMENKRDNLIVIFAGYEKELENLFELNPGLRDRIPHRIHFPNYNREELAEIFRGMLPGEFKCTEEFTKVSEEFFTNLSDDIMNSPNFSNARFVRNLVERILSKAALRMQMNADTQEEATLTESDFNLAVADNEFAKLNEKKRNKVVGF